MTTIAQKRVYGWHPGLPDPHAPLYAAESETLQNLPTSVDQRQTKKMPAIDDQKNLGACTGFALIAVLQIDELNQQQPPIADPFHPSPLFVYYNERKIQHTIPVDSGSTISIGIRSISTTGYCPESLWPYNPSLFAQQPPLECYQSAKVHKALKSQRITSMIQMKAFLASGLPVAFGFTVYQSFESQAVASTGIVPMPQAGEAILGGHAVACIGYDDSKQWFIVRNSWSASWGDQGHFYLPYGYVLGGYASDFWVVQVVE